MKFKINYTPFKNAVTRVADAVFTKGKNRNIRCWANQVTIHATVTTLKIAGFGKKATLLIEFTQEQDGYACDVEGIATVTAEDILHVLDSCSDMSRICICATHNYIQINHESSTTNMIVSTKKTILISGLSYQYIQKATVNRESFLHGLKKVKFAMPREIYMECYQCIYYEVWGNTMRFTAGSGSRFATFGITSDNPMKIIPDRISIIIPKWNINNLIRLFNRSESETLQILYADQDTTTNRKCHIVLKAGAISMTLHGSDIFRRYPDIDSALKHSYPYRIPVCTQDWKRIGKSIHLARQTDKRNLQLTEMTANLQQGCFDIRISSDPLFTERIEFMLGDYVVDMIKDKHYEPWIRFDSDYVEEIAKKIRKEKSLQMCFEDQDILNDIPEGKPKKLKPMVVRFPSMKHKNGTRESFTVFFGLSTNPMYLKHIEQDE